MEAETQMAAAKKRADELAKIAKKPLPGSELVSAIKRTADEDKEFLAGEDGKAEMRVPSTGLYNGITFDIDTCTVSGVSHHLIDPMSIPDRDLSPPLYVG